MIINPIIPLIIFIPILVLFILFLIKQNKKLELDMILIIILIFLINLRPMTISENVSVLKNNLDVLFVIDNSISMEANDYTNNKTRLSGVKKISEVIIKELNGARFSVMSFSSANRILLPFMSDATTALETIQDIKVQDELNARGTSLNTPLEDIISSLERSSKKENRRRIIFFFSDGEITNDDKLKSFSDISEYVSGGAVLGFGTESGSTMLVYDKYTEEKKYLYDYSNGYEKAISKMDEGNLKSIADDMKVSYIHVESESDCNQVLKDIKDLIHNQMTDDDSANYTDIYYLFTIPLFLIILYKFYTYRRTLI